MNVFDWIITDGTEQEREREDSMQNWLFIGNELNWVNYLSTENDQQELQSRCKSIRVSSSSNSLEDFHSLTDDYASRREEKREDCACCISDLMILVTHLPWSRRFAVDRSECLMNPWHNQRCNLQMTRCARRRRSNRRADWFCRSWSRIGCPTRSESTCFCSSNHEFRYKMWPCWFLLRFSS